MPEVNEPTAPQRARRGTKKHPMDYTGREGEQLQAQHADEIADAAERMSTINVVRPKRTGQVHDYTSENRERKKVEVAAVRPKEPEKYQVRILADIDDMTFGHEWIDEPEYDEHGNMTRPPGIGPLLKLSFKEGEEYLIDPPLYHHLAKLGYVYGAE